MVVGPWKVLQEATKAVPAIRYAVGLCGIIAVIAIVRQFGVEPRSAVFGSIIILVLMTGLFVFARLSTMPGSRVYFPSMLLLYAFVVIIIFTAVCLATATFLDWPKPLHEILALHVPSETKSGPSNDSVNEDSSYRRVFFEGFDVNGLSPEGVDQQYNSVWLLGKKDAWTGSVADGVHRLTNTEKSMAVLTNRTAYLDNETNKTVDQSDCKVLVSVRMEKPNDQYSAVGLLYRAQAEEQGYYLFVLTAGNNVSFARVSRGRLKFLWSQELKKSGDSSFTTLKIIGNGPRISLYVEDKLVHIVDDAEYLIGDPGIYVMSTGTFILDDYAVYLPADGVGQE